MKQTLSIISCLALLVIGCTTTSMEDKTADTEILELNSGYSIGWSLDSTSVEMQTQEAALLCREMGVQLQIIDTRTTSPKGFGVLPTGDVQFQCVK